jgi:uncharacterized protein (DUF1810 family)
MADAFDLQRFVDAQAGVYPRALEELRRGRKQTHWIWFVFPQLAGLGSSPTAQFYALRSLAEAQAYLAHPVLGPRLRESAAAVNAVEGRSAHEIFGSPDDLKFRSSMTLFQAAAPDEPVFGEALDRYFEGRADERTLALLRETGTTSAP